MTEVKMQDTKLKGERENNGLYTWSSLVFCMFIKICKNYPQKTKRFLQKTLQDCDEDDIMKPQHVKESNSMII